MDKGITMFCKYCNKEQEVISESKYTSLVTLDCNHTVPKPVEEGEPTIEPFEDDSLVIADFKPAEDLVPTSFFEIEKHEGDLKSSDGRVPYPFQNQGMDFIKDAMFRALIADEMGLGKTIQALGTLRKYPKETLPALIVVKSSLKAQWFSEVIRWCGVSYIPQVITDGKTIPVEGFNVYIVSYDIIRRFTTKRFVTIKNKYGMEIEQEIKENPFYDFPFKTIILDEAQSIKNIKSTRTDEVFRICKDKQNVIALSGTPFKNNILEYFPILHLLQPAMFPTIDSFERNWVKYGWVGSSYKAVGLKDLPYFKEQTSSFIIRRERKEVLPELPEINRVFQHVDFESEKLKRQYYSAEDELIKQYEEKAASKNPVEILGIMAVVRHLVGLTKVQPTVEKITEFLLETDRKLTVFVHHHDVRELIYLLTKKWCLDGGYELPLLYTGAADADALTKFKNSNARVLIASTLSAGEGLNLQFCSDCILVERQWNPANEEQVEGRFIRIGQERSQVNAMYMIVSGTIDEWFTQIVEEKRRNFKSVMSGQQSMEMGSLLEDLMKVIIAKGRKRTVRGF